MSKNNFQKVTFRKAEPNRAVEKEVTPGGMVNWSRKGTDNKYSSYLIDLYNRCAMHKGIVNSKVFYLVGEGLSASSDASKQFLKKCNPNYGLNELRRRTFFDMALFDGFAWEITYNKLGDPLHITHVPFTTVRTNESKTKFWVCRDWADTKLKGKVSDYGYWMSKNSEGQAYETVIYYYSKYSPNNNGVYPVPSYSGALGDIETMIDIVEFHQSNIKNGFTATKIINFKNGKPATEEEAQSLKAEFEDMYTGTDGNKFILAFTEPGQDGLDIHDLSADNSDKMYQDLRTDCVSNIISAHSLTSKLLAAVETPGSLGSTNELKEAYYAFMKLYVRDTRAIVDEQLMEMLADFGYTDFTVNPDTYLLPEDLGTPVGHSKEDFQVVVMPDINEFKSKMGEYRNFTVMQIRQDLSGKDLYLTVDQIRACIQKLADDGEINIITKYGKYTINKTEKF